MAWYRIGTVAVTNGSKTVTGTGTAWVGNVQPGDAWVGPDGGYYEVDVVASNTSLTLVENYAGTTASGAAYKVIPTQGRVRDLTAQVLQLIQDVGGLESAISVLSGRVGIGTATPVYPLAVATTGDAIALSLGESGSATGKTLDLGYWTATDVGRIQAVHAGTGFKPLALNPAGGNVGIGTLAPSARLEVRGDEGANVISATGATVGGLVSLRPDGNNGNAIRWGGSGAGAGVLRFLGPGDTERMRIDNVTGAVGIGALTPLAGFRVDINNSANNLVLVRSAATSSAGIEFAANGNVAGTASFGILQDSANNAFVLQRGNANLTLGTNSAARVVITGDGNTIFKLTSAVPSLASSADAVLTRVSDTQARLSMRGADGTTRSVTWTLA